MSMGSRGLKGTATLSVAVIAFAICLIPSSVGASALGASGAMELVSIRSNGRQTNGFSSRPTLDAKGKLVAFDSSSTNMVRGDTNQALDVFVHDRSTDRTKRVSVSFREKEGNGPAIVPRSAPTVASWSSCRVPPTWFAKTRTEPRTSS